jgi:hypothetical protein
MLKLPLFHTVIGTTGVVSDAEARRVEIHQSVIVK